MFMGRETISSTLNSFSTTCLSVQAELGVTSTTDTPYIAGVTGTTGLPSSAGVPDIAEIPSIVSSPVRPLQKQ